LAWAATPPTTTTSANRLTADPLPNMAAWLASSLFLPDCDVAYGNLVDERWFIMS
jgi:hypothetical protein